MSNPSTADTRPAVYPSEELPAPPAFAFDVPVGWEVGQIPGMVAVTGPTEWDGPFRTNVTVSTGLVARDASLPDLARAQLAGIPEAAYEVQSLEELDADTVQLVVTTQLADPAVSVLQSIVLVRVGGRPAHSDLADLFTITASCEEGRGEDELEVLLGVVRSFRTI